MDRIAALIARQPGMHSLLREFYRDAEIYRADVERVFERGWLLAGHSCEIPRAGDYFTLNVDTEALLIIRGEDGVARAMHNVCRHRGSLICESACGHAKRLVCPYHQWTYGLDGKLLHTRGMQEDLNRSALGLRAVHLREVAGLLFISLAANPPSFDAAQRGLAELVKPQGLERAKVAKSIDYYVKANWKLVWENNRECYHCNATHPQYIKANYDHYNADDTTPRIREKLEAAVQRSQEKWAQSGLAASHTDSGMTYFPDVDRDLWWLANRTPLADGYVSETLDGKTVAPLMGDYPDPEVGTLRIRMMPNFWHHGSCDHAVSTLLLPVEPQLTWVRVTWLVDERCVEGKDYALDRLLPFWQLTSEQDWAICERQQRGVNSRAYAPGPYSTYKEYNVDRFIRWYLAQLQQKDPDPID